QVIYQTCGEQFKVHYTLARRSEVLKKYRLPNTFLLYVGSIIPRKNLLTIVEALAQLSPNLRLPLVVVGNGKTYKKRVMAAIQKYRLQKFIFFPNVSYQDLPLLYQSANIFLYPSMFEGFGIPILEALYAKTPIITCRCSSLPEAGGGGAYYVTPNEVEDLRSGIAQVLCDNALRKQLLVKGQQHLQYFDSALLTKQLVQLYQAHL
ncbi:MAG: glycosyltransferase family 1 protein, partial [Bacteroidota bacterium]